MSPYCFNYRGLCFQDSIGGVDLPFLAALRAFVQVEAVPDVLDPFPLVDMVAVFGLDVAVPLALRARGSEVAEKVPVLGSVFFPVEFVLVESQIPSAVSLAQRAFDGGPHVFGCGGRSGEVDESVRVVGIEISFHGHVSFPCHLLVPFCSLNHLETKNPRQFLKIAWDLVCFQIWQITF